MANKQISKDLLSSIQKLVTSIKGQILNDDLIEVLKEHSSPIMKFYDLNHFQSIVFSIYLEGGLKDIDINTEKLLDYFGKNMSIIADINETIEYLIERKLVFVKPNDYSRQRKTNHNRYIQVYDKVLDSLLKGDNSLLVEKKSDNFIGLLGEIKSIIISRIENLISTEKLGDEIIGLLELNKNFVEVEWILNLKDLSKYDIVLLLDLTIEHLEGADEVDFDKLLREIFSEVHDRVKYKKSIKEEKCKLFKLDLIKNSDSLFSFANYVSLTDYSLDILLGGYKEIITREYKPKMGNIITPEMIDKEFLYYNKNELEQIETLTNALSKERYENLVNTLTESKLKPGFTVLLYGYPGTGKTSSVKQIAKETNRAIFMVDVDKIQSKWVGESEKNLSKIFEEYRICKKTFNSDLILLFNEADAILGKRFHVNNSVDKSYNTLQNILLQELEDFEGIFMATTNLADQLDSAFDRRLLYKIEFKKPENEVRFKILNSVFKDISETTLITINKMFDLTGGQISNIRKKLLVKSLLKENLNKDEYIIELCKVENVLNKNITRNPIGFNQ